MKIVPMRHLIERVLELADDEEGPAIRPSSVEEMESNDACLLYTSDAADE